MAIDRAERLAAGESTSAASLIRLRIRGPVEATERQRQSKPQDQQHPGWRLGNVDGSQSRDTENDALRIG